ncbi:hypothetical protein [Streptomyces lydicus]|uniref:hypothetical protein n=1 Tax=Streptomyces lydicus TaxID=47763 RepID=UPI00052491B6|nr:hypothetical protein [Streptomyces lydicus]MDC7338267.1 hypothetical protein [Streptomyces lydicus]
MSPALEPHTVILAGVAHNNPHYDPGWSGFFLALVVIAGCLIVLAGLAVTIALLRVEGRKLWGHYVIGPAILVIGLATAAVGFQLL